MKATNSALRQLIEGTKVFAVPLYQRRYSWERKNWTELWQSILEQYDYSLSEVEGSIPVTHFIGSFVLAPAPGAASAPNRFVLVDGQQRLTTTMLALAALRDLLAQDASEEASRAAVIGKYNTLYLHNAFETDPAKKLRLLPTQQDRHDYESCVGRTPADPVGRMGEAYNFFRSTKALRGTDLRGEPLDLNRVSEVLLSRLSLVEITTETGDNVHRIFQTLNSAGVKLKQVDLLRNHFFMLLPTRGEDLYVEVWRDMELRLGEAQLDRFFWAELVRTDARVSRTDVYAAMQRKLEPISHNESSVEHELRRLNVDSHDYLAIVAPTQTTPASVEARLSFLRAWGAETARPLILELLVRLRAGRLSEEEVAECLLLVESFFVRRMIVGIPTNNLNRIFSSLTPALSKVDFGPSDLKVALTGGSKYWPSNGQVSEAVLTRPFYFSGQPGQRRLVMDRLANFYAGKEPSVLDDNLSIEHVMPQTPSDAWLAGLAADPSAARQLHDQFVHTIGNLTLTGYNSELGNKSFEEKRAAYASSGLAMTRNIAATYQTWNVEAIKLRSTELASAVLALWPGPQSSEIDVVELGHAVVEDALLLLPAGGWTFIQDLMEVSGLSEDEVANVVAALPEAVAAKVRADAPATGDRDHLDGQRLASLLADNDESE